MSEVEKNPGLPTADEMRRITRTEDQVFQSNVENNMSQMMEEMAAMANQGKSSHVMHLNMNFPPLMMTAIVNRFKDLGYSATIEEVEMTPQMKAHRLTVSWE